MTQHATSGSSRQGTLRDLAQIVYAIRRSHATGRLTIRNTARLGVAHLYFRNGQLMHVVGNLNDASATLADLQGWTQAVVRFERSIPSPNVDATGGYEQLFEVVLNRLQMRGIVNKLTPQIRVVEGQGSTRANAEQLITPAEWKILVEGTRRITLAVASLVGPKEAMAALRDILDDCSAGFPALSGLQIDPTGYLRVADLAQFDRVPRAEMLEGFAALFEICQYFCSPVIGEQNAHRLLLQALQQIGPALVSLGVFHIDQQLLGMKLKK